jgi:hypothetical protein
MERMGPEASLMMSSAARRSDLAEFARLEYSHAESRRVPAILRDQSEGIRSERSVTIRLAGWLNRLFRRADVRTAPDLATGSDVAGQRAEILARISTLPAMGLAAVSAARAGALSGASASPLSVAPVADRMQRGYSTE